MKLLLVPLLLVVPFDGAQRIAVPWNASQHTVISKVANAARVARSRS